MKRLLPVVFLAACNTHDPARLVGSNGTELNVGKSVNFASQSYTSVGFDKYGHPRMIVRDNSEAVPIKGLDTGTAIGGAFILGDVQKSKDAADAAVAMGAQKAASKDAATAAGVEIERIKSGIPHP